MVSQNISEMKRYPRAETSDFRPKKKDDRDDRTHRFGYRNPFQPLRRTATDMHVRYRSGKYVRVENRRLNIARKTVLQKTKRSHIGVLKGNSDETKSVFNLPERFFDKDG